MFMPTSGGYLLSGIYVGIMTPGPSRSLEGEEGIATESESVGGGGGGEEREEGDEVVEDEAQEGGLGGGEGGGSGDSSSIGRANKRQRK